MVPLSRLKGAKPARAAASRRLSVPSSGICASSSAAVRSGRIAAPKRASTRASILSVLARMPTARAYCRTPSRLHQADGQGGLGQRVKQLLLVTATGFADDLNRVRLLLFDPFD